MAMHNSQTRTKDICPTTIFCFEKTGTMSLLKDTSSVSEGGWGGILISMTLLVSCWTVDAMMAVDSHRMATTCIGNKTGRTPEITDNGEHTKSDAFTKETKHLFLGLPRIDWSQNWIHGSALPWQGCTWQHGALLLLQPKLWVSGAQMVWQGLFLCVTSSSRAISFVENFNQTPTAP